MTTLRKIIILTILLIGSSVFAYSEAAAQQHSESVPEGGTYTVERVIDGDTLKLTNGEEVRLIGIKAPKDEKMGQEATRYLKNWLKEGIEVRLEFDVQREDKYGRLLAYVYVKQTMTKWGTTEEGEDWVNTSENEYFLNKLIIQYGYATPKPTPPNLRYVDLFRELYEEAREKGRGLWKDNNEEDAFNKSKYFCESDNDCVKYSTCFEECVNKNFEKINPYNGVVCGAPWEYGCKCLENRCIEGNKLFSYKNKRSARPVADLMSLKMKSE